MNLNDDVYIHLVIVYVYLKAVCMRTQQISIQKISLNFFD